MPLIENPSSVEVRAVIRFLNAKQKLPTEIHKVVVEVYGENEISYLVRKPRRQTPPEKRGVNGKLMLK
jgi:hypothetical protein